MAEVSDLKLLVPRDRRCPSIVDLEVSKMDNRQSFIKAVLWFAGVSVTDFFFFLITPIFWRGFPGGSNGKESACNAEEPGLIPGLEDPLEEDGAWQPTLVFLVGESHGQRSLEGYSSWITKESDMTEQLTHTFAREPETLGWKWSVVPKNSFVMSIGRT